MTRRAQSDTLTSIGYMPISARSGFPSSTGDLWILSAGPLRLSSRYRRTSNIDDLEAAISKVELAVSATPEDNPNRAAVLNNLGFSAAHNSGVRPDLSLKS